MKRLSLIVTVSLALTVAYALTSFQNATKTTTADKIIGTFYYGGEATDKLVIKNKFSTQEYFPQVILKWKASGQLTAHGHSKTTQSFFFLHKLNSKIKLATAFIQ